MNIRRFFIIPLLLLFGFSIIPFISINDSFAQVWNDENNKIKLGLTFWAPNFLAYVANEKGFFAQNNLDVEIVLEQDYVKAINKFMDKEYDAIFEVYSDAIIQFSDGIEIKVIYNLDSSNNADVIVGKAKDLAELEGKKIGVEGINSFSHLFVLKSLEKVGLEEGDVEFVNIPSQNLVQALDNGTVYAGHIYEPFSSVATSKGYNILSTGADIPGTITNVLAIHSETSNIYTDQIELLIESFVDAKEYYEKNKEDALSIMSSNSGIDSSAIERALKSVILLDLQYNNNKSFNRTLNDTSSLFFSGNNISHFFAERGVISNYPNLEELIEERFVDFLLQREKK